MKKMLRIVGPLVLAAALTVPLTGTANAAPAGHLVDATTSAATIVAASAVAGDVAVAAVNHVPAAGTARYGTTGPKPLRRPQVQGPPAILNGVYGFVGRWPQGVVTSRQWLRDGKPIRGATDPLYYIGKVDFGHKLSLRVRAYWPGVRGVTTVTSKARQVTRLEVGLIAVFSPIAVQLGSPVTIHGQVQTGGNVPATGTLTVLEGTTVIAKLQLPTSGKFSVSTTPTTKGNHRYVVKYSGNKMATPGSGWTSTGVE